MIDKNTILKFVKHVHKRGKGIPDRRMLYPQREWLLGLVVFILAIGGATFFSVYLFGVYENLDKKTYEVTKEIPKYNSEQAVAVLEMFEKREIYFNALVTGIQSRVEIKEQKEEVASTTDARPLEVEEEVDDKTDELETTGPGLSTE